MYQEIETVVRDILFENKNIQILKTSAGAKKAILYRDYFERVDIDDVLIVNHTATALNLGTGGYDIVKHVFHKRRYTNYKPGHIMKLRYTPSQLSVLSVEAQESPYHSLFLDSFTLNGRYILLAELHSMIPVIYQLLKQFDRLFTMTVIIDDEAALPLSLSEHVRILKQNNNFQTITIGQAYGGDFEAVNLQTALQFATKKLQSDFIVVSLAPGVVGTGTLYGYSGMVLANWANIIGCLHGVPVWVPRISYSDQRERHYSLSHHIVTPLKQFTYAKSILPLPKNARRQHLLHIAQELAKFNHITIEWEQVDETKLEQALKNYPIPIKTMGRKFTDDPHFFYGIASAVQWLVSHS